MREVQRHIQSVWGGIENVVESTVSKTRLDEAGEETESKLTYSNVTSEVVTSSATSS